MCIRDSFYAPSAEELAFNSQGACRTCSGTGKVRTVDETTLVPDESLTIEQGAVCLLYTSTLRAHRESTCGGESALTAAVPQPTAISEIMITPTSTRTGRATGTTKPG